MKHTDPPSREVSIYVQPVGKNKFKIQIDQLEQIGAQLRGTRQFSIFHSVILPLIVGGSIFSALFQYLSWSNAVAVQDATEVATNAMRTYEKVVAPLATRHYAAFVFLPSLRDLINAKSNEVIRAYTGDAGTSTSKATLDVSLHKLAIDIKQQRFASYYEQLKFWNENYDRWMSDIELTFDRPIFSQAGERWPAPGLDDTRLS
jgi:hypothetical protein